MASTRGKDRPRCSTMVAASPRICRRPRRASTKRSPRRSSAPRSRLPLFAGLAVDVLERDAALAYAHDAEQDRELEAPGTCRSRVEDGDAAIVIRERHVGVTAHD